MPAARVGPGGGRVGPGGGQVGPVQVEYGWLPIVSSGRRSVGLPTALQPWLAFWPFPLPDDAAPLLSWHPRFPDRAPGLRMSASLIPFVDARNLLPIPTEGGGQQLITLGVEIGVTDVPVLGGWVPF